MKPATRRLVRQRAKFRCEYCQLHEDYDLFSFHLEYIMPSNTAAKARKPGSFPSRQLINLELLDTLVNDTISKKPAMIEVAQELTIVPDYAETNLQR